MADYITRFEGIARRTWSSAIRNTGRYRTAINLTPVVLLFLLAVCWQWIVITVPAGHVAVRWWRFFGGTDISRVYSEGTHFNFPWDKMTIYDARIQTIGGTFDALTSDGLLMKVQAVARFRLNVATVGLLHKYVGPDYIGKLVQPALSTYVRAVLSQYSAEQAYGVKRLEISDRISNAMAADLVPKVPSGDGTAAPWIVIQNVLITSMKFPQPVEAAINRKIEQYEARQEDVYRLEREHLESERKEVEAEGIARFQQIVGASMSKNYLRWKGIEATLALAQSPNSKVVVIGTPGDGLPLILGGLEGSNVVASKPLATTGRGEAQPEPQVATHP
ncbi:MAG TPA: prohibitin family protein [Acetobacteraceae bacterium]|nr:prohibitin family protein [Acetobacteraceae bacterium]